MKRKQIISAYIAVYMLFLGCAFLVTRIFGNTIMEMDSIVYGIQTCLYGGLAIYIVKCSKSFLIDNVKKLLQSFKCMVGNFVALITTYIITFLLMAVVSSNIQLHTDYTTGATQPSMGVLGLVLYFLSTVILGPFIEEIVFRGAVFGAIRNKSIVVAHIVTAFVFGLLHIWLHLFVNGLGYIVVMFPMVILGLGISIIYERTNNFIYAVLFHMIHNGLGFTMSLMIM